MPYKREILAKGVQKQAKEKPWQKEFYVINEGIQQTKVENGVIWFIGVRGVIDSA